jgi:SOS response regulatory protein OraA/RecX
MSSSNGANPPTDFDQLAEQIGEQYDRLVAEREPLKQRLAELDADVRRLERMLHIARPELREQATEQQPQRKPKNKVRTSDETKNRVVEFIQTHDPSPYRGFDRDTIAEGVGLSASSVSYALKELREQERVRLVGKRPRTEGQIGISPLLYTVMPNG